jgi:hypothetical protein
MVNLEKIYDDLSPFEGFTVYIDWGAFVHKHILGSKLKGKETGGDIGHIKGIIDELNEFEGRGIKIVWVFDPSKMPDFKQETVEKRDVNRPGISYSQSEAIAFLLNLGQTIVHCDLIEAEHWAAIQCRNNPRAFVYSSDSDVLMYGGNRLWRKAGKYYALWHRDILDAFNLNHEELAKVCVYLGTDYAPRVPQHGPATIVMRVKGEDVKKVLAPLGQTHVQVLEWVMLGINGPIKIGDNIDNPKILQGSVDKEGAIAYVKSVGFDIEGDVIGSLNSYFSDI